MLNYALYGLIKNVGQVSVGMGIHIDTYMHMHPGRCIHSDFLQLVDFAYEMAGGVGKDDNDAADSKDESSSSSSAAAGHECVRELNAVRDVLACRPSDRQAGLNASSSL